MGAGSVGGYFGARLQQAGEDVIFLVRDNRKGQLDMNGIRVKSYLGNVDLKVRSETEADKIESCDVVIVAIRNFNFNESVFKNIDYFAKKGTDFISLLNGVEHIDKLRKYVSEDHIIGGSAFIDSRIGFNGEILHRGQDPTIILGTIGGIGNQRLESVLRAFEESGIRTQQTDDLMKSLWKKYIFVLLGSFTGVINVNIGAIVSNKWLNRTLNTLADEIQSVARKENIYLEDETVREMLSEVRGMRKEWKSLLTEDIEAGRKTELESLWGFLIRKAENHGLEVPVSSLTYGVFKLKEVINNEFISKIAPEK